MTAIATGLRSPAGMVHLISAYSGASRSPLRTWCGISTSPGWGLAWNVSIECIRCIRLLGPR